MKRFMAAVLVLTFIFGAVSPAFATVTGTFAQLEERFSHGTDITREDVAEVYYALIEYYAEEFGFDYRELLEIADIADDIIINILWHVYSDTSYSRLYVLEFGEPWLLFAISDYFAGIVSFLRAGDVEYMITELRIFGIYNEFINILGFESAQELLNTISISDTIFYIVDIDINIIDEVLNNPQFIETLEQMVSEHGADIFSSLLEELYGISDEGLSPGLMYLDTLLGGIISENQAVLSAELNPWPSYNFYAFEYADYGEIMERFPLGENFSRADVSEIVYALTAHYLTYYDIDFMEIAAAAGYAEDAVIDLITRYIQHNDTDTLRFEYHGPYGVFVSVDDIVGTAVILAHYLDEGNAANFLVYELSVNREIIRILGDDASDDFNNLLSQFAEIFDVAISPVIISVRGHFLETLEFLVSAHGTDIFSIDFIETLAESPTHEIFTFLDELLGGYITENFGSVSLWVEQNPDWYQEIIARDERVNARNELLSLFYLYSEYIFIDANHFERKYWFDINRTMYYELFLLDTARYLNLHFENRSEFPVSFAYMIDNLDYYFPSDMVEIPPGGRYTVQIDFADYPEIDTLSGWGYWAVTVYILAEDDNPVFGELSFRMTDEAL